MSDDKTERLVAVNRGVERSDHAGPIRGEPHRALDAWIGRWINRGHMIDEHSNAGLPITTSVVYEWAPGGFFVVHTAFGRIGEFGAGSVEIIGYDDAIGEYASHFFDRQGNRSTHRLIANGDAWTYQGDTTRATGVPRRQHGAIRVARTHRRRIDIRTVDARHLVQGGLTRVRRRPALR